MLISARVEQRSGEDRREEFRGGRRADDAVEAAWEDLRCRQCRRLLAKNTRHALRAGSMLELKCSSCNTRNYLVGIDNDD